MNETIETYPIRTAAVLRPAAVYTQPPRPIRDPAAGRNGSVLTTRVGLQMPPAMNFDDWEQAGRRLAGILDSSAWWLGDWLVYGKDNYADRYQRGIRAAGLKYQTLRNYAWVSRRFDQSRRRAKLTFQHHAEVASLPLDEQELWLQRAEELSWTTKQLRTAIQEARNPLAAAAHHARAVSRLPVPENRLMWWNKAAECTGVEFEAWVLMTLDSAAQQVLADGVEGQLQSAAQGAAQDDDPLAVVEATVIEGTMVEAPAAEEAMVEAPAAEEAMVEVTVGEGTVVEGTVV
ncbi:MAG TPA: LmbU family transcriptional regulator, partial [Actinospica sp.]|nr:LmbU family transcriptional regulator [Actinospica sp.]